MKKEKWEIIVGALPTAFLVWAVPALAFAEDYGGGEIGMSLGNTINWIVTGLGAAFFVIGMVIVGIRMTMHDEHALKKGGGAIAGGLIILLAEAGWQLLKRFTGH